MLIWTDGLHSKLGSNPAYCLCQEARLAAFASPLPTAARIGSSTNLFSRARTIGRAKGASTRATPLSRTSATMEYRVPCPGSFEPVNEPRIEAPLELFQPDLLGRNHDEDVDHIALASVSDFDRLSLAVVGEESYATDRGREQPGPPFVVGVECRHQLGRRADLCRDDGVNHSAAPNGTRSVGHQGN